MVSVFIVRILPNIIINFWEHLDSSIDITSLKNFDRRKYALYLEISYIGFVVLFYNSSGTTSYTKGGIRTSESLSESWRSVCWPNFVLKVKANFYKGVRLPSLVSYWAEKLTLLKSAKWRKCQPFYNFFLLSLKVVIMYL